MYNNRRFVMGPGGKLHDATLMPWSEERIMSKPYIHDGDLRNWITFPSEQIRRAYVQAAVAVKALATDAADRARRLRQIAEALDGVESSEEPKG